MFPVQNEATSTPCLVYIWGDAVIDFHENQQSTAESLTGNEYTNWFWKLLFELYKDANAELCSSSRSLQDNFYIHGQNFEGRISAFV